MMSASSCVCDRGLLGGCWCQKTPRSGSLLACRYMVLTNTEIAPLPAPILRSACPLHPRGSPNSRAPPARAPRHIPKPPPTHIPTSPTVPIRVYGGDNKLSPRIFRASRKAGVLSGRPGKHPEARKTRKGPGKARKGPGLRCTRKGPERARKGPERPGKARKGPERPGKARIGPERPGRC